MKQVKNLAPYPLRARLPVAVALFAVAAALPACGPSAPPPVVRRVEQPPQQQPYPPTMPSGRIAGQPNGGGSLNAGGGSQRQRQSEFLNRIRQADPQHKTIEKAVLNEQNELGVILDKTVDLDSIPALMRSLLTQMAREFPGQDLEVMAYAPSNPPMKIGTAHYDSRTRGMNYEPAHR